MFSIPKILQRNKAKEAMKEEINTLKDLLETQGKYTAKRIPIEDGLFRKVRAEIAEVVEHVRPSGSNGRVAALSSAIQTILDAHGVTQEQYWGEVWRRSGQKDLSSYNKPSGGPAAASPAPEVGPGSKITIKPG